MRQSYGVSMDTLSSRQQNDTDNCVLYASIKGLITSAMAKVVFSVACLFVCLSVSNITDKRLNRFSWNFQDRGDLIQGTIGNILNSVS